ncbi:carboxypeptidase-like regulatory domain-containing protein [Deltaproteobacteria bacterium]|nr:carboxypeptidase-like regulatory domain-containing protein [Deltaproteobacteria bacterium]
MRYLFGFLCVCALVGCTDDGGTGGSGGSAGSGGTGGTDQCEGAEDGTACSDGACLDGACTALTTVSGTVTVDDINNVSSPGVGATVSVLGTSLSTTTDERGEFSFGVFTGDWFFQSEKDDLWGFIRFETVPTGVDGLELDVVTDAVVAEIERDLGIDIDDTKGVISVNFGIPPGEALGGETAELSEAYEYASATNADGDEVLSNVLFPEGGPDLTFWNVDLTEELVVTPKGVEGVNECSLKKPGTVYPIRARFVTLRADAQCTPVTKSNGL